MNQINDADINKNENVSKNENVVESFSENKKTARKGKLDYLEPEIKMELDRLVASGAGPSIIRKALIAKFAAKTEFVNLSYPIYAKYIKQNKERILKEKQIETSLVEATQQTLSDVKSLISDAMTTSFSIENKAETYQSLVDNMGKRLSILQKQQNAGYFSNQTEVLINAYNRDIGNIIRDITTLRKELVKDLKANFLADLDEYTRVLLTTVYRCYKQVNGQTNFANFCFLTGEQIEKTLKTYRLAKEKLDENP